MRSVPDMLKGFIKKRCIRHIAQQCVEDAFNCVKSANSKKSNSTCTSSFAWATLLDKKLLETKYEFREVDRRVEIPDRNATISNDMYCPVLQRSRLPEKTRQAEWHKVAGFGDATWFSPGASGYMAPLADIEVSRQAVEQDCIRKIGYRDYSRLVQKNIIVRRVGSDAWMLGAGCLDGTIAVLWPLKSISDEMWVVDTVGPRQLHAIFSPDDLEAAPIQWLSPLHRAILSEFKRKGEAVSRTKEMDIRAGVDYGTMAIVCKQTAAPKSLWQTAASEGWWDLPLTFLRELMVRRGVECKDVTIVGVPEGLFKDAYPEASADMVIAMLEKRGYHMEGNLTHCEDLMSLEYIAEAFDRNFAEQLMQEISEAKDITNNYQGFVHDVIKYKDRLRRFFCFRLPDRSLGSLARGWKSRRRARSQLSKLLLPKLVACKSSAASWRASVGSQRRLGSGTLMAKR